MEPPAADRRPTTTEHHGRPRVDDYEWLREKDAPEVRAYLDAENAYTEAMTATPPEVTDELVADLREQLADEQLVELTEMISLENLRSRTNSALGLTSQGFKDHCEVPAP